jgi:hypothetical protein
MVMGHCGTNPSFSKANRKYLYRNKVQMCSVRDVKHKTMSKICMVCPKKVGCSYVTWWKCKAVTTVLLWSYLLKRCLLGTTPCVAKWPFSKPCCHRTLQTYINVLIGIQACRCSMLTNHGATVISYTFISVCFLVLSVN